MARLALLLAISLAIVCLVTADTCSQYSSCKSCAGKSEFGQQCRWCTDAKECTSISTPCSRGSGSVSSPDQCNPPDICSFQYTCTPCVDQIACTWCASPARCINSTLAYSLCPRSSNRYSYSCPTRTSPNNGAIWIVLAFSCVGVVAALILVVCIRRRRVAASIEDSGFELQSTSDYTAPSSEPSFTNTVPGYMYTTTSNSDNQPQYVYTAVPIGAPVASIPE